MNSDIIRQAVATGCANSPKAKILQVGKYYPPHRGGIETYLQTLCCALQDQFDVQVVVASDDDKASQEVLDGVSVCRVATKWTLSSAPLCPGMISKIRASDADIVHIHLPNPMAALAYLASGHRGQLVVSYHSDTVRQRVLGTFFEPFLHRLLRRSSAIIVSSPHYQETSSVLANYRDRCHVIPYGIDLNTFEHPNLADVARLRQQYGDRLVISVGRLVYYKGFEYLIRAMKDVRGRLLIIGDGPLRAKLRDLAAQSKISDKICFAGIVPDDLSPYYHAADVFVLASIARSEAFGIVQIEAMASGLPVVNTQLDSGVPFVSLHGQTGLTVPPADSESLAKAINRLLDDEALRRSLGNAARLRARQEFSLEAMVNRTMALYSTVMPPRSG